MSQSSGKAYVFYNYKEMSQYVYALQNSNLDYSFELFSKWLYDKYDDGLYDEAHWLSAIINMASAHESN